MQTLEWVTDASLSAPSSLGIQTRRYSSPQILMVCALTAFLLESALLVGVGWREHWLAHPQKTTGLDEDKYLEAQVFQLPENAHLVEEKKPKAVVRRPEPVLSRIHGKGKARSEDPPKSEENETESGPKMAPTHGPVAVFAPSPVIPPHLQDRAFKTSVVIDFFVNSLGHATPRLTSSSGNEELDAIAIASALRWQFRPAEKDHHPYDSHTRLRIVFEVR